MDGSGSRTETLRRHFREAFARDAGAAYRDWFRAQEELREDGDAQTARELSDDLWERRETLVFGADSDRARFLHNLAVFLGSPGPAASLPRARHAFSAALAHFEAEEDGGWISRTVHNFATAISNLGESGADLEESERLFEKALSWRTEEREIARAVTLHNLGLALRRHAELAPGRAAELLAESAERLDEARGIRERLGLDEGRARSLFHRGITLARLAEAGGDGALGEAQACLSAAADAFEQIGKHDSAAAARQLLAR
ncbi:MAG: hypothetical protein ABI592_15655 [Acidobacteriota bacterium]